MDAFFISASAAQSPAEMRRCDDDVLAIHRHLLDIAVDFATANGGKTLPYLQAIETHFRLDGFDWKWILGMQ